jgi:O-antigen chain-terminating methyltransferase
VTSDKPTPVNGSPDITSEQLSEIVEEIRDRVRSRHPETSAAGIPFPDLMPLVHARDAAEAKVAAIGTVNPRPPGFVNNLVQAWKRFLARVLDWHVREQVEFNRAAVSCVQSTLDALSETNRSMSHLIAFTERRFSEQQSWAEAELSRIRSQVEQSHATLAHEQALGLADASHRADLLERESRELKDIRAHWAQWRQAWEERRNANEVHVLRTISELQGAYQHRLTNSEVGVRELVLEQNRRFHAELGNVATDIQQRLWQDLQRMRGELEKTIFAELKQLRQRSKNPERSDRWQDEKNPEHSEASQSPAPALDFDWLHFANKFRGSEEDIRARQQRYIARFQGAESVLDLGCGRGEFLEAARDAGIPAQGIDASEESIALCKAKGLSAEKADLFTYLEAQPDRSLAGVYCSQVVEHLQPAELLRLIRLLYAKMRTGARLAIETPNPECLAIFATHFYLDPTHTRPVPPALLAFYLEETGFGVVEIERLYPASETIPAVNDLPAAVREQFFGAMDYACFAQRL